LHWGFLALKAHPALAIPANPQRYASTTVGSQLLHLKQYSNCSFKLVVLKSLPTSDISVVQSAHIHIVLAISSSSGATIIDIHINVSAFQAAHSLFKLEVFLLEREPFFLFRLSTNSTYRLFKPYTQALTPALLGAGRTRRAPPTDESLCTSVLGARGNPPLCWEDD
jgi:hypothetical protein